MSLQRFQLDIAARLEGSSFFANVPVFILRPRAALTAAQIQDKIITNLGALTTQNGKAGLCAAVLMPVLSTQKQELPGPYLHLKCTVRVQENVIINMGANGAQTPCEDAAINVAQVLHLGPQEAPELSARRRTQSLPTRLFQAPSHVAFLVESELELPCLPKNHEPLLTNAAGTVAIHCADPAAAIWYTLDGTAPWAGNATYPATGILSTSTSIRPQPAP